MREMTNADFVVLLQSCPSTDQEEVFEEAARRINALSAELQAWKAAADGAAGCDTPEGLANFIYDWGDYC